MKNYLRAIHRHGVESAMKITLSWLEDERKHPFYSERIIEHDIMWLSGDLSEYAYLTEGWC